MSKLKIEETSISDIYVITPTVYKDNRGYFMETCNEQELSSYRLKAHFVQDNQSMSKKGVLRGLHYQKKYPQCKLIRVIKGKIWDVVVDIRENSNTYGKWFGIELSAKNKKQLYISEGFAHGYLTLSNIVEVCYKTTNFYHPEDEYGIRWDDADVGIVWKDVIGEKMIDGTPLIISDKDRMCANLFSCARIQ